MNPNKKMIIYGAGDFAEILFHLISACDYQVVGFVSDYAKSKETLFDLPVINSESILAVFPPEIHSMALGFSGKDLQKTRAERYSEMKNNGYSFPNIIHPSAQIIKADLHHEANLIFEGTIIGYKCTLGTGNVLWQNCVLPHHNTVGNFNSFAPSVSLSGFSTVGNHCFLGNNSSVNNHVYISDWSVLGAGAYAQKSVPEGGILVPQRSILLDTKDSRSMGL